MNDMIQDFEFSKNQTEIFNKQYRQKYYFENNFFILKAYIWNVEIENAQSYNLDIPFSLISSYNDFHNYFISKKENSKLRLVEQLVNKLL